MSLINLLDASNLYNTRQITRKMAAFYRGLESFFAIINSHLTTFSTFSVVTEKYLYQVETNEMFGMEIANYLTR